MSVRRNASRLAGLVALVALAGTACGAGNPTQGTCGNRAAEGAEECDDGNDTSGDGCSATCALENASALCAGVPTVAGTALASVRVASGLAEPVHVTAPRLDPNRLFVVEQPGRVRVIENGVLRPTPFLAIEPKVLARHTEQGLLSIAFHPDYEANGRFFVSYTAPGGGPAGHSVVAQYRVSADDPNRGDPASELILLTVDQPFANHNGGLVTFGPDGALYFGLGDGGSACDPGNRAQDDASRLGKLLRLGVDASPVTIETWGKGLRNPWRFAFDRATGDLYIADVGQYAWEEIHFQPAPAGRGRNYGWNVFEGRHCPVPGCRTPPCVDPGFVMPVLEYDHTEGCSITGGFVYRGCRMPDLRGTYFYSDYCRPFIKTLRGVSEGQARDLQDRTTEVAPRGSIEKVSSFGEDARGELYIADHADGEVYRIVPGSRPLAEAVER